MGNKTAAQAAETLRIARETLDSKGWVKNSWSSASGAVCLLRAIQLANGPGMGEAERLVHTCIGANRSIPNFNDDKATSYQDVINVLLAAEYIAKELAE